MLKLSTSPRYITFIFLVKEKTLAIFFHRFNFKFIREGNPLKCTENTKWILNREKDSLGHKIADKEHLRCTVPYDGRALIPVVEIINVINFILL